MKVLSLLLLTAGIASAAPATIVERQSTPEILYCANPLNTIACYKAQGHADVASSTAAANFPANTLHNGKGDAFRHCYWNARMAIDIGVSQATNIANKHEEGSTGPAAEKSMDLFNNSIGRSYGVAQGTFAGSLTACKNAANSGVLRTLI